jgi:haloalkane dehalogenase
MSSYRPPKKFYPFQSRWLDLDGVRMHYLDEGPQDAPAVLMLHGNPTWSFYYRYLVLALRDRFRCIVPDHIGCGLSDKPSDEDYTYTLVQRIADVDALIAHLDPQGPVHMIVHDWGGMIGFGWATATERTIGKLVIANTAAFPMPESKKLPAALWLVRNTALGALLVRGLNAFSGLAAHVAFKKPVSRATRRAYTGPYDSWDNRIATLRFVQDIPLAEGDPGFATVLETEAHLAKFANNPCLLAWGEKDFVFDQTFQERWQQIFPHARLLSYPDCGHYVFEDAGPGLVKAIGEFLDGHDDGQQ